MSALYIMVPAALALGITALISFIWAVRNGQFDDPESDAHRLLSEPSSSIRNPKKSRTKPQSDHN